MFVSRCGRKWGAILNKEHVLSLMQKSWSALCSADLQIGDDGDDACQNAHREMGATKHLDTERFGFQQAARLRTCLTLGIVVTLLCGSGIVGATPPPQDIDPEAWAKVRAQLDVQGQSGDAFSVYLDEIALFENVLFIDGFETGTAGAWD